MKKRFDSLQLRQISVALAPMQQLLWPVRPSSGWARAVREALGMPAAAAANALGMTSAGVRKLEQAEANQVISLSSLRKLADALGCDVQYALVPRQPLAKQLQERARKVAAARLGPVSHSMALEDQAVQGQARAEQTEMLAQELLDGSRRELWRDGLR